MEAEALEEAEAAIEAIVRPLKQSVELLPRAVEVRADGRAAEVREKAGKYANGGLGCPSRGGPPSLDECESRC
jgi:hypothetical protein